jgi:hypothetical protein
MVKYILSVITAIIVGISGVAFALPIPKDELPEPVYPSTEGYIDPDPTTTTTVPAPRPIVIMTPCEKVRELARMVGWPKKELNTLVKIAYRESRCTPRAHNKTRNADGSQDYGLMQINDWSWCKPTKYYPKGYLQQKGIIEVCKDLFNPILNLASAYALYEYSNNTWKQWNP